MQYNHLEYTYYYREPELSILGKSRSLKRIGVLVSEGERLMNLVDVES